MTQIRRQGDEVPSDFAALRATLLQDASCECMSKVVDTWLLAPL